MRWLQNTQQSLPVAYLNVKEHVGSWETHFCKLLSFSPQLSNSKYKYACLPLGSTDMQLPLTLVVFGIVMKNKSMNSVY